MKRKFVFLLITTIILAFVIVSVSCGKNPLAGVFGGSSGNFSVGIAKI